MIDGTRTQYFTAEDAWIGGYYELWLQLGRYSPAQRAAAFARIWSHPDLDGCYQDQNREPADQTRVTVENLSASNRAFYGMGYATLGIAGLPDGRQTICQVSTFREQNRQDTLIFQLPIGMLEKVYPEIWATPDGLPDMINPDSAISTINRWLVKIAGYMYEAVPFQIGYVGWQISDLVWATGLWAKRVARDGIPTHRGPGYIWPWHGKLEYYPSTSRWSF